MNSTTFQSIRERCGHTTASLADFLRVTQRQVQMIEKGQRNPSGPMTVIMELLDQGRL